MRNIYRNRVFYYLFIPALVGVWPLLVWGVYLPRAEQELDIDESLYVEGQTQVVDILRIDPERLELPDANQVSTEFSYGNAVDRVATLCRMPASNCTYMAGGIMKSGGKRRQDAMVKLSDVSIVQAAEFLSRIQSMYVNLTCEKIKLTRRQGMPDQWGIDLNFVYYY